MLIFCNSIFSGTAGTNQDKLSFPVFLLINIAEVNMKQFANIIVIIAFFAFGFYCSPYTRFHSNQVLEKHQSKPALQIPDTYKWETNQTYKKSIVRLFSGEVLNAKSLVVLDSTVQIEMSRDSIHGPIPVNDIEKVYTLKGHHTVLGVFAGCAIGVLSIPLATEIFGNLKITGYHVHNVYTITGSYFSTTKTPIYGDEKTLDDSIRRKWLIGHTMAGALIGSLIPRGWIQVYPLTDDDQN